MVIRVCEDHDMCDEPEAKQKERETNTHLKIVKGIRMVHGSDGLDVIEQLLRHLLVQWFGRGIGA